MSNSVFKQQ